MLDGARGHLRAATAVEHARTEDLLAMDDRLDAAAYERLLATFVAWFEPAEAWCDAWPTAAAPVWPSAGRAALAAADLCGLGWSPDRVAALPRATIAGPTREAEVLGLAYVLEGSALGAAILERRVEAALPDAPCEFLSARSPARWHRFVEVIEDRLPGDEERDAAAVAANAAFQALATAAAATSAAGDPSGDRLR